MRESARRPETSPIPQRTQSAADLIEQRIEGIARWMDENCPECATEQRHLDEGTRERQYWHYGYLVALRDIQKLLGDNSPVN